MYAARFAFQGTRLPRFSQVLVRVRNYASESGKSTLRRSKDATHTGKAATGETAISMGQGFAAGGAFLGLGALCFYGLGLANEAGAVDRAVLWPEAVRHRIRATYMYFGSSLGVTAASAYGFAQSPTLIRLVSGGGWMSLIGVLAAMWGTGILCQSIPYQPGLGAKQLAWLLHSAVLGAVVAPMTFMGGPLLLRAAVYTAGMVAGLSTVALCAPSERFLNWGGPLAMGLGVVFMASISTMFLPPNTALGAGAYSIAIYGGLVLFGMFLLYDTQKIIRNAESTLSYGEHAYDPINNSVGIYLDTLNIFIRIASILASGGNRRK